MKYLAALLFFISLNVYANQGKNKPPTIDAYISVLDEQHLSSVRVNIEKSFDSDGKIERTEISFDDGFVSSKKDIIHQYAVDGIYNVTVKVWDNKGAMSQYSQSIDVASNLVFSGAYPIYGPNVIQDNRKISFSGSNYSANKKYKLILTKQVSGFIATYYEKYLDWFSRHFNSKEHRRDNFEVNIELNGIDVFAKNEITKNTVRIEKFVILKNENQLKLKIEHASRSKYKLEVKQLDFAKDVQPPVISTTIQSELITNNNQLPIAISDISDEVTTYVWKVMPQAQLAPVTAGTVNQLIITTTQSSFNIPLTEGANYFIVQSVDRFNNRSDFVYLNNIILDTTVPLPVFISPAALANDYTYQLPYEKQIYINFSEKVKSVIINGIAATIDSVIGKSAFINILNNQSGENSFQIIATDLAGNTTQFIHKFNVIHVTAPPVLSVTYPISFTTKESTINLPFSVQSQVPTKTVILVNDAEVFSTHDLGGSPDIPLAVEGTNNIDIIVYYAVVGFDTSRKTGGGFQMVRDTVAPQIVSSAPEYGATIYTNHLPLIIPVNLIFNEILTNIKVNNLIGQPTFSDLYSGNYFVSAAGVQQLQIEAIDRVGNISNLTHSVNVDFSDVLPVLEFNAEVKELLTNKISVPISGTSDKVLTSATLNGLPISIGQDGKTFSGIFEAPRDGRFQLAVTGTDLYGNVGTTSTFIRVLQGLPDALLPPSPPSLVYDDETKSYIPDFGPQFKQPQSDSICEALDNIFEQDMEFKDNLANLEAGLQTLNSEGIALQLPRQQDLEAFMGDVEEKLNYLKAPYLMMCKGVNIIPESDCPTNRKLFKLVMGSYPEPLIIRSIPGLPISVQNFLIPRLNICTGFDDSGLSCNDMVAFLPLIADFIMPGVGQMMSSPAAQAITKSLMCDELCNNPAVQATLVCTQLDLPEVPNVPSLTPILLPPRLGGGISSDDWGGGGNWPDFGGDSCGSWFEPSCPSGGGGAGGDGSFMCSSYPTLWLCGANGENSRDRINIDVGIDCNILNNSRFGDLNSIAVTRGISVTDLYSSYMAKCFKSPLPGFPKITEPVLTVSTPVQNQQVTDTVQVTGYVDDIYAQVKVNGQLVSTKTSILGGAFDVTIATPVDRIVRVEAADLFGNRADVVELVLNVPSATSEIPLSLVAGGVWSFIESISTGLISEAMGYAGAGDPHSVTATGVYVFPWDMTISTARPLVFTGRTTVFNAEFVLRRYRTGSGVMTARIVGSLNDLPNMADVKATTTAETSSWDSVLSPRIFNFAGEVMPSGSYWLVLTFVPYVSHQTSHHNACSTADGGGFWFCDKTLSTSYGLSGSIDNSKVTLSADAFVKKAGMANTSNRISAFTSDLSDGEVLYTTLNSVNTPATLTLVKADMASVPNMADIFIVARRVGNIVYIANNLIY